MRKILRELDIPEGLGVIIRTVGEGQRARYFVRDLSFLLEQWSKIEQQIREQARPCVRLRGAGSGRADGARFSDR